MPTNNKKILNVLLFSIISLLLVLGVYVLLRSEDSKTAATATDVNSETNTLQNGSSNEDAESVSTASEDVLDKGTALQPGWRKYTLSDLDISFAYPESWGNISGLKMVGCGLGVETEYFDGEPSTTRINKTLENGDPCLFIRLQYESTPSYFPFLETVSNSFSNDRGGVLGVVRFDSFRISMGHTVTARQKQCV